MTDSRLQFRIDAEVEGSRARAATFKTLHNVVETPVFMPVGTQASVKAQLPQTLAAAGSQILLANTYHLLLRPGVEVFRKFGGIHRFMTWDRSVLTDSGGYQIFSLPNARAITDEGAVFRSYVDGTQILLSPRSSIETQMAIGSDIMMVLDQCVPSTSDRATVKAALDLTHRWAARSLDARGDSPQSLFGIIQGALFEDLRRESVDSLTQMPFDGFAIGGLAVGESKEAREEMCELTAALMPRERPRYLMGVGTPIDLLEAVHRGVDMFDCIIPTQLAQRGGAFTSRGYLQMRRSVHKFSEDRLDPVCPCPTCERYSRAYLHHLTKASEPLGWHLLGQHNIYFYHRLMRDIRRSIIDGTFLDLYRAMRGVLDVRDLDNEPEVVKRKRPLPPATLGAYAVDVAPEGFGLIRHVASGETMHAHTSPIEEARSLYVEQSMLRERVRIAATDDPASLPPLVVYDIGLGAAANAMAALEAYQAEAGGGPVRGLKILSFENDLDSLRLASRNSRVFPYLKHGAPGGLLERGRWTSKKLPHFEWQLLSGDFRETMATGEWRPDIVFFDPFSSKTDTDAWTLETFRRLLAVCDGRPVEVFTYSASTAVRAAMLAAGFLVARGRASDAKSETTIALTAAAMSATGGERRDLLDQLWLDKWKRSHAKAPSDVSPGDSDFERRVLEHPQFRH